MADSSRKYCWASVWEKVIAPSMGISSHLMQKNILVGSLIGQVYRVTGSPSIFALGAEEYHSSGIQASKIVVS